MVIAPARKSPPDPRFPGRRRKHLPKEKESSMRRLLTGLMASGLTVAGLALPASTARADTKQHSDFYVCCQDLPPSLPAMT